MRTTLLTLSAALAMSALATVPLDAQRGRGPSRAATAYVIKAGAGDLYEIQSSQLAASRARRPQVREFARMLVADHNRSTQMVAAAAREDGLRPPPPMLEPAQRTMLRQLERARGATFDRMYLNQQIPAHQQGLALHRNYARHGDGRALTRTAAGIVPVVQGHLARARQLAR
jgi:putative membrane protein